MQSATNSFYAMQFVDTAFLTYECTLSDSFDTWSTQPLVKEKLFMTPTDNFLCILVCFSYRSLKKYGRKFGICRLCCCISREPFELKSPNFTCTSMPTCTRSAPDMTSLTASDRKLQRKRLSKMPSLEFLENPLSEDHQISHGCRVPLVPQTCWI